jgi:predicted nucleic acid-binding Zn ribbon protein
MPIYEYVCSDGHRTERVKSIKISPKKLENDVCDTCGANAELTPSRPGAPILVGRGFHANDYGAPTKQ